MNWTDLNFLLAQAAAPAGPKPPPMWTTLVPMVFMFGVLYFVMIRPQQKKANEHTELLKQLKKGDKVVTNGGVVGVVLSVRETTVTLRSEDTKLEVLKSAVSEVTERASTTTASKE